MNIKIKLVSIMQTSKMVELILEVPQELEVCQQLLSIKKGVEVDRKVGGVPESHMKEFLDKNI
jgi:hypothetical protein